MPINFAKLEPQTLSDSVAARLEADEAGYTARFLEGIADTNNRLRQDGSLSAGIYDYENIEQEHMNRAGRRLLRELPVVRAYRDELRDRGRSMVSGATRAETAAGYLALAAIEGRVQVSKSYKLGNGDAVRLRTVLNGSSDRIEARYTSPTSVGNFEAATSVRRALEGSTYNARLGFRRERTAIDLTHEQRGDGLQTKISALTFRSVKRNGWMFTGAVERVESLHVNDTRVVVGAMYAGREL